MDYIVLDMEWNQPMSKELTLREPVRLLGEVLQIGAVRLDDTFRETGDTFDLMVKPCHYPRLHWAVKKLTHITNDMAQKGVPFAEAIERFRLWCGEEFAFLTWGGDDMRTLYGNLVFDGLDTDWLPPCYDMRMIYIAQVSHSPSTGSLSTVLEALEEPMLPAHDALHDALGAAALCRHLNMEEGIAQYGSAAQQPVELSRLYSRKQAREDAVAAQYTCPHCGKELAVGDWCQTRKVLLYAQAACEDCGRFLLRVHLCPPPKSGPPGPWRIRRETRAMTKDREHFYRSLLKGSRLRTHTKRDGEGFGHGQEQQSEDPHTVPDAAAAGANG